MNAIRLSKQGDCISLHSFGAINAILVAGIAHKLFGAISSVLLEESLNLGPTFHINDFIVKDFPALLCLTFAEFR